MICESRPPDAERCADILTRAYNLAARVVGSSWPGPAYGAVYHANLAGPLIQLCAAAGMDTQPLSAEWQARYESYRASGGRAKFVPLLLHPEYTEAGITS